MTKMATMKAESDALIKASDENYICVTKLADTDDIEAYLTTFERLMTAYGVNKSRWIFKVAPQLTGKAQQAYAAVSVTDASDYDAVKAAILRR